MNWRKTQRKANKIIRNLNENIKNDEAWHGRFYARQIMCSRYFYEDDSGVELYLYYDFIDKKTGLQKLVRFTKLNGWYDSMSWKVWCEMNDFIVKDCKADFREKDDIDYDKIHIEPITFGEWRKQGCWHGRVGRKEDVNGK